MSLTVVTFNEYLELQLDVLMAEKSISHFFLTHNIIEKKMPSRQIGRKLRNALHTVRFRTFIDDLLRCRAPKRTIDIDLYTNEQLDTLTVQHFAPVLTDIQYHASDKLWTLKEGLIHSDLHDIVSVLVSSIAKTLDTKIRWSTCATIYDKTRVNLIVDVRKLSSDIDTIILMLPPKGFVGNGYFRILYKNGTHMNTIPIELNLPDNLLPTDIVNFLYLFFHMPGNMARVVQNTSHDCKGIGLYHWNDFSVTDEEAYPAVFYYHRVIDRLLMTLVDETARIQPLRVAELSGGEGRLAKKIMDTVANITMYTLFEFDETLVDKARKNLAYYTDTTSVVTDDASTLQFGTKLTDKVDIFIASGSILTHGVGSIHITHDIKMDILAKMVSCVKQNGLIVLTGWEANLFISTEQLCDMQLTVRNYTVPGVQALCFLAQDPYFLMYTEFIILEKTGTL